ncbi:hypothetical protein SNOG_13903 [Parastagonospora nodorum SN15]|uniref:Uncharacterized protein n=1 Tax=Phaeosphaeria nodorum (strain SN15 / ATCC MYA-4574 / FGSC 10173) TaxID=321614 RepID=Q0U2N1_PHANO|nr:hypothetical protein SNOG_13903 [Parastagonospora nodorum SN15]EAT78528.1 hypothetical protein SNOG_13903 [Parastagonospora nodorum SN15]
MAGTNLLSSQKTLPIGEQEYTPSPSAARMIAPAR